MSEQDIDYSYEVVRALTSSMMTVADNPAMLGQFLYEYVKKLPDIVDAVKPLIKEEHLGVVGELLKASGVMSAKCLIKLTK